MLQAAVAVAVTSLKSFPIGPVVYQITQSDCPA
jgi:hypothetical protein